jgi:hypothetical protein
MCSKNVTKISLLQNVDYLLKKNPILRLVFSEKKLELRFSDSMLFIQGFTPSCLPSLKNLHCQYQYIPPFRKMKRRLHPKILREAKKCHLMLPGDGTSRGLIASHINTLAHSSRASNRCNEAEFKFQRKKGKKPLEWSVHASTLMLLQFDDDD